MPSDDKADKKTPDPDPIDVSAIRWGKLPGNVGYLRIDRVQDMDQPNEREEPDDLAELIDRIKQDAAVTDTLMKQVITDLAGTQGMIVDLRFNDGGYDAISLKIASYFSELQQVIGNKQARNKDHHGEILDIVIDAAPEAAYIKPVYVVTGQSTASGGEVLSMALKALPQVTLIGEPTSGDVSDSLSHILPNGWYLSLRNGNSITLSS